MDPIIHPIWLIDEYVMIFRNLVWFTPISPLIVIDEMIIIAMNISGLVVFIRIVIGAIFCHVSIIRELVHESPSIISGNQKWKGAAPIFVSREESIIIDWIVEILLVFIEFRSDNTVSIEIRRIVDAIAWVMKYFIAASDLCLFFCLLISGMIDSRFISRPIHIPNQLFDVIVNSVPNTIVVMNRILKILCSKKSRV